jgi:hypothetical protein
VLILLFCRSSESEKCHFGGLEYSIQVQEFSTWLPNFCSLSSALDLFNCVFIARSIIGVKSAYHFGTLIFFHARKVGKRSIVPVIWTKLLFRLLGSKEQPFTL